VEWVFFFIFSITGKPPVSPNEAAWNQIVLSEGFIFSSKVEKILPSTKDFLIE
jgi:hypothetical protein